MAKALKEGLKAPAFSLPAIRPDGAGEKIALKDFAGKKIILFFYPKDDTPGCTKEAIGFSDEIKAFANTRAVIIGISKDSVARHERFKEKHGLKVILASDEPGKILEKYGVWVEKSMYGRKFMGIERATFLIDAHGVIAKIWRKVKVAGHVEDVLAATKAI